jgi:hypothetical protein
VVPGELLLGDLDGLGEILVGQFRIDNLVSIFRKVGRFDAAWDRLPAVEEEDFHAVIVSLTILPMNALLKIIRGNGDATQSDQLAAAVTAAANLELTKALERSSVGKTVLFR